MAALDACRLRGQASHGLWSWLLQHGWPLHSMRIRLSESARPHNYHHHHRHSSCVKGSSPCNSYEGGFTCCGHGACHPACVSLPALESRVYRLCACRFCGKPGFIVKSQCKRALKAIARTSCCTTSELFVTVWSLELRKSVAIRLLTDELCVHWLATAGPRPQI